MYDGPLTYTDIDYQRSTSTISASWLNFTFTTRPIGFFQVAIGTLNNSISFMSWRTVGLTNNITFTDLTLVPFSTVYVYVKCVTQTYLAEIIGRSNGVRIVTRAPSPGIVMDGALMVGQDRDYQEDITHTYFNWYSFYNEGVPLVYTATLQAIDDVLGLNAHNISTLFVDESSINCWTNRIAFSPPLVGLYRILLCASNPVGDVTCVPSDGYFADDQPPTNGTVHLGITENSNIETVQEGEVVYATWVTRKHETRNKG